MSSFFFSKKNIFPDRSSKGTRLMEGFKNVHFSLELIPPCEETNVCIILLKEKIQTTTVNELIETRDTGLTRVRYFRPSPPYSAPIQKGNNFVSSVNSLQVQRYIVPTILIHSVGN